MNVNEDFTERVLVHGDEVEWEDSPMPGVQRRRLERLEGENERVTTIVRYAPGSRFSSHVHGGGEESIILEGTFEDDYGEWPAGSYTRNPPTSSHTPGSKSGCTLFVKLWQFDPQDRTFVHANLNKLGAVEERNREGVKASPLYRDECEDVRFEKWAPNSHIKLQGNGGAEVFVIEGNFKECGNELRKYSWLRMPVGDTLSAITGPNGAVVWIKSGHLRKLSYCN